MRPIPICNFEKRDRNNGGRRCAGTFIDRSVARCWSLLRLQCLRVCREVIPTASANRLGQRSALGSMVRCFRRLCSIRTGLGQIPRFWSLGARSPRPGGLPANNIAMWDGSAWHPLGTGVEEAVWALAAFDEDGPGPNPPVLFAGGYFTTAGGVVVNNIARWDGANWSSVGGGAAGKLRGVPWP
jgi:hypothetical protein